MSEPRVVIQRLAVLAGIVAAVIWWRADREARFEDAFIRLSHPRAWVVTPTRPAQVAADGKVRRYPSYEIRDGSSFTVALSVAPAGDVDFADVLARAYDAYLSALKSEPGNSMITPGESRDVTGAFRGGVIIARLYQTKVHSTNGPAARLVLFAVFRLDTRTLVVLASRTNSTDWSELKSAIESTASRLSPGSSRREVSADER